MGRITVDPDTMMGKPVIAGTRITVESVIERLASGETMEDLLAAHPRLVHEDVLAALDHAVKVLRSDLVYFLPEKAA